MEDSAYARSVRALISDSRYAASFYIVGGLLLSGVLTALDGFRLPLGPALSGIAVLVLPLNVLVYTIVSPLTNRSSKKSIGQTDAGSKGVVASMPYCVKCGAAYIEQQHAFCRTCGSPTGNTPDAIQGPAPVGLGAAGDTSHSEVLSANEKKARARKWVNGYSAAGGGVAAVAIIPGATTAALFTLETTMVLHIGRIYRGAHFSKEDAVAVVGAAGFMGTIGLGSKMAMEGLNFFPVIGWAIKGGIAASVIKALGEAIIKYFESIEHHK